jgi:hypothetical protein
MGENRETKCNVGDERKKRRLALKVRWKCAEARRSVVVWRQPGGFSKRLLLLLLLLVLRLLQGLPKEKGGFSKRN